MELLNDLYMSQNDLVSHFSLRQNVIFSPGRQDPERVKPSQQQMLCRRAHVCGQPSTLSTGELSGHRPGLRPKHGVGQRGAGPPAGPTGLSDTSSHGLRARTEPLLSLNWSFFSA